MRMKGRIKIMVKEVKGTSRSSKSGNKVRDNRMR